MLVDYDSSRFRNLGDANFHQILLVESFACNSPTLSEARCVLAS
jgi:hypothetical protein